MYLKFVMCNKNFYIFFTNRKCNTVILKQLNSNQAIIGWALEKIHISYFYNIKLYIIYLLKIINIHINYIFIKYTNICVHVL